MNYADYYRPPDARGSRAYYQQTTKKHKRPGLGGAYYQPPNAMAGNVPVYRPPMQQYPGAMTNYGMGGGYGQPMYGNNQPRYGGLYGVGGSGGGRVILPGDHPVYQQYPQYRPPSPWTNY